MTKKLLVLFLIIFMLITGATIYLTSQQAPTPAVTTIPQPTTTATTPPITTEPIEVTILSNPQAATISVDGLVIGQTPLQHTFQKNQSYQIKATKDAYIAQIVPFTPTATTLRLQLEPANTVSSTPDLVISNTALPATPLPSKTSSPTAATTLSPLPFPTAPNLRVVTRTNNTFVYTPTATPSSSAIPDDTDTAMPQNTLPPTTTPAQTPSAEQISSYHQLIAQYSGVHDFPADDPVQEGTSDEKGVIVSTNWLYTENLYALAGFPIRFISDGNTQCTLHALSAKGDLTVGALQGNDSLTFTAAVGTNEAIRFSCQERPMITLDLTIFS